MGVPGAPRIERTLHPTTISTSARCARISATDHLSGAGRLRNFAVDAPFTRRSIFLGVAAWTFSGAWSVTLLRIRAVYCCGDSVIDLSPTGFDEKNCN